MEYLNRGIVAVRRATNQAYIGWRLLGTDPADIAFNLYRSAGGGAAVKLNASPLTHTTDFVDSTANFTRDQRLFRPPGDGRRRTGRERIVHARGQCAGAAIPERAAADPGRRHDARRGENYTYNANDASVGDLDGDGQYEIILKWDPSNSKDNSQSGFTGNVFVDAYSSTARGCGGSTWAATFAPALTTRSSWSTTSMATAGPKS